jgi:Uma2 family endonuclease
MSSAVKPDYYSDQEYLQFENQSHSKSEYVDGWIRAMTGASLRHNVVAGNCFLSLGNQLKGSPCRPYNSDTKLRIDRGQSKRYYYPDVQVVCRSNEPTSVYQDQPVLIIEVLSPSTRNYDLNEKLEAYLQIPSLECYIVLEQHQPIATVFRKTNDGFSRQLVQGTESNIDLPFFNGALSLADIYEGVEFTETCVQESDPEYELSQEATIDHKSTCS